MIFTVAVDGPAAAGKGTISRAVAAQFGFAYLDTGLLYRAVGVLSASLGDPVDIAKHLQPRDLDRPDLRSADAAIAASKVAALSGVRRALLDFQRAFAQCDGGAVLDGRDIGTVICPNADAKLFVTARDNVRAQRRLSELLATGADTTFQNVLADVRARDARDTNRQDAPLRRSPDAYLLDTSELSIDAAVTKAVAKIKKIIEGRD